MGFYDYLNEDLAIGNEWPVDMVSQSDMPGRVQGYDSEPQPGVKAIGSHEMFSQEKPVTLTMAEWGTILNVLQSHLEDRAEGQMEEFLDKVISEIYMQLGQQRGE